MFVLTTNQKGGIAETKIAAAATELGISVLRPIVEHGRYDLAFEIGERILRVQCKWGALDSEGAVIKAFLRTSSLTPSGYVRSSYAPDEIDLVAVYCGGTRPVLPSPERSGLRSNGHLPEADRSEKRPTRMH